MKEDQHFIRYYDAIYILFNTGLRISEFCGLTKSDISVTMNTYTHVTFDDAKDDFLKAKDE